MLKILIDQDFDHDILRGIIRRLPNFDYVTAFQWGLNELTDEELLFWAKANDQVWFTHDKRIMPEHFLDLIETEQNPCGVFIVPRSLPVGQAIDELEIIISCSENDEWENVMKFLPL